MLTGSRLFFLSPQRDAVLSEPAIQVRRKGKGKQIWALEKMENRLVDMRELYQEWKELDEDNPVSGDTNYNDHKQEASKTDETAQQGRSLVRVKYELVCGKAGNKKHNM